MGVNQVTKDGARASFLELREKVGLPPGGEIVLKDEVRLIAWEVCVDPEGTKNEIMARVVGYGLPHFAPNRSFDYMTSSEADRLVREIEAGETPLDPARRLHGEKREEYERLYE